jgi:cytochrome P450
MGSMPSVAGSMTKMASAHVVRGLSLIPALPALARDPLQFTTELSRKYGSPVSLDLGVAKIFFISHPDHIRYALRENHRNIGKRGGIWDVIRMAVGNGLVTSEGEFWRRQRRMMQPHFSRGEIANLTTLMVEAISEGMTHVEASRQKHSTIELTEAMEYISMRVIVRTLFGTSLMPDDVEKLGTAMRDVLAQLNSRTWAFFMPRWLKLPGDRKFSEAVRTVDRILHTVIDRHRDSPASTDLLSVFLNIRDAETGEGMTSAQLRDEMFTMFAGGYETVVSAVSWAFYLLARNPDAQKSLREEVEQVCEDRAPTVKDVERLTYAKMVMQETMRLYPSLWAVPRTLNEDDTIGGHHVPGGSLLVILLHALQRDPAYWENPDVFDPERFRQGRLTEQQSAAYLPFGAGPRMCIGNHFALVESVLILAMMTQRYQMRLARDQPIDPYALTILIRPKGGISVVLDPS